MLTKRFLLAGHRHAQKSREEQRALRITGNIRRVGSGAAIARMRRIDPTRTAMIVKKFEADLIRRFKKLRAAIGKKIIEDNMLGLAVNVGNDFSMARDADKVNGFMAWLRQQQNADILEIRSGQTISTAGADAWANVYIDSAYQRGIANAGQRLSEAGVTVEDRFIDSAFNRPIHADRLGLLYTRDFAELNGITEAMDQGISRSLTQSIAEGRGARETADALYESVDDIGIRRARMLARTETITAHTQATLNLYEEAGVEGVEVDAEFSTAGDDNVCPECEALEGSIYTLDEAQGVIPVHPNCRCAFLPIPSIAGLKSDIVLE